MEVAVLIFTTLLLVAYAVFLLEQEPSTMPLSTTLGKVKIVVPFKNEEARINTLLQHLVREFSQKDNVQVFFVDDKSTDKTQQKIEDFLEDKDLHYLILPSFGAGKKRAIETASQFCSLNDFMLTLDADVQLPKGYAQQILNLQPGEGLNVLEIDYPDPKNVLQGVVKLESLFQKPLFRANPFGNMPALCSGAHLLYPTHFFERVQPYASNINVASGDDMFFLDTCHINQLQVNSNSLSVLTEFPKTWKAFVKQRLRWLSKTAKLKSHYYKRFAVLFILLLGWPMLLGCINLRYAILFMVFRFAIECSVLIKEKSLKTAFILPFYWLLQYGMPLLYIFGSKRDEQTW